MPENNVNPAENPNEAENDSTILENSDSPVVSEGESVLDTAGAEEKAAQEAENKRILEADESTLKPEEKTKRAELVKAQKEAEEKRLMEEKQKGVPEKYDVKLPEGVQLEERFSTAFKKLGFTNAQAQGIIDLHKEIAEQESAKNEALLKQFNEENTKETMKALGANAKAELAYVAKVKAMLSEDTIEALNASGIGNLKSFIFDMAKIGRLFSEEKLVNDKRSALGMEDAAAKLYPSMQQQQ